MESLFGLFFIVVVAIVGVAWPLYFIIFFINQGNAVRRALFSTLLLEHVSALIRLGLPLTSGVAP